MTTDNTLQLTTSLGQRIHVFAGDHIGNSIRRHGLYEKERLLVLRQLLQRLPAPVVLDVGANIGNHTLVFATCAAHVHAFEPLPAVHALLARNVAANGLTNVKVHAFALSDSNDSAELFLGKAGNVGMSSFDSRSGHTGSVRVVRRRGDDFLAENGIGRIDFVKIDVEGHEFLALQGLLATLRRDLPFITLEWNDPAATARFNGSELWQFLTDNYRFFALDTTHDRTVWQHRPLAFLHRKWHRLWPRKAVLHGFEVNSRYDCVLLVPRGREELLQQLDCRR